MGRKQQPKCGGYARNTGTQPYAGSKGGQGRSKTAVAATAPGLGVPQNPMLSGMAGLQGLISTNTAESTGVTGLSFRICGDEPLGWSGWLECRSASS